MKHLFVTTWTRHVTEDGLLFRQRQVGAFYDFNGILTFQTREARAARLQYNLRCALQRRAWTFKAARRQLREHREPP